MGLMDLFRPRWRHSDSRVRSEATKALTDQAILAWLARWDSDDYVRQLALERLTDHGALQGLYAELAKTDDCAGVRIVAAVRLQDQSLFDATVPELAKVIQVQGGPREVKQWLNRVTDQSVLARIAESCVVASIRTAAIKRVTDPAILNDVVLRLALEGRLVAIRRVTDPVVLRKILEEGAETARTAGIVRTIPPDHLAAEARLSKLRAAEVARLSDTSELARIATSDPDRAVRTAALATIADQETLTDIATSCNLEDVAEAAVGRVTSPTALTAIAKQAATWPARAAAVGRLNDEMSIAEVAEHDQHEKVSLAAVSRLRDQDLLAGVAERSVCAQTRAAAVRRLDDEGRVTTLAAKASSLFEKRLAIAEKLVELGWTPRTVEEGCSMCNGTGVVWVNLDSAFERDVASYLCQCGLGPYSLTVCCEKPGKLPFEITCGLQTLERARREGTPIPPWLG